MYQNQSSRLKILIPTTIQTIGEISSQLDRRDSHWSKDKT